MWCHQWDWWRQRECRLVALWQRQQGFSRWAPVMLGCLAGGSLPGSSKLLGSSKLSGLLDRRRLVLLVLLDYRV